MLVGTISRSVGAARPSSRADRRGRDPLRGARPGAGAAADPAADELPRSIRRAVGSLGFHGETIALAPPARATAAARAFAAGNGYLPGLIVDRLA